MPYSIEERDQRFNPRLTSAARRTRTLLMSSLDNICFNPRLTSAARRTEGVKSEPGSWIGFNPRLTSAARRTSERNLHEYQQWEVSIHASPQRQGERVVSRDRRHPGGFNPRLTSAARRTREPAILS